MASEIRVDKINSLSGVGTVTLSPTGVDIAGITTASTLRATTGIITTLQVGTISGDGSALTGVASTENIRTNTNATFLQNINVSGSTTTGSLVSGGAISGTTGTFTGDVDIADKIVHTGDTNTAIRFPAADTITAETGGSERARIDSNGKVIIGHNASVAGDGSSEFSFQILGTSYVTSGLNQQRYANDVSGPSIILGKSRATSVGTHTIVQNSDQLGKIRFYGSDGNDFANYGAEIAASVDGSPGNNDMPGRLEFKTTPDGGVSPTERLRIGADGTVTKYYNSTSTPQFYLGGTSQVNGIAAIGAVSAAPLVIGRDSGNAKSIHCSGNIQMASGYGIDFSAASGSASGSSTAILDDYEEGTWTPTYLFGGSDTATYSARSGSYTKIGNYVFAKYAIDISARGGSGSGRFDIGGLPFTIANVLSTTGQEVGGMITYWNDMAPFNLLTYWGQDGNNYLQVQYTDGDGRGTIGQYVNRGNLNDNTGVRGYVIYNSS